MTAPADPTVRSTTESPPAHLIWRLFGLIYDLLPVLAIWFAVSAVMLLIRGGQPVAPGSLVGWLELFALWLATGGYAVLSWRKGGQTLGQRAWRLRVIGDGPGPVSWRRLWLRYGLALVSLAAGGLGFLWALIDPQRRTWHDLACATRVVREPRRS
ncbi:MAG: RDD family protein [Xanthomonadaceae bacterium]|nr:RDD family protein [Xanthomonadaceae bacterium]